MRAKEEWEVWEEDVAKALGGTRVVASGATNVYKGDVKTDGLIVDCKYTKGISYTLRAPMWQKMLEWGRNEGRDPMLAVRCLDKLGNCCEYAVVPEPLFCEMAGGDFTRFDGAMPAKTFAVGPAAMGNRRRVVRDLCVGRVVCVRFARFLEMRRMRGEMIG